MSRHANPTVIGGFVVGAIALVVAGILAFSSGQFFTEKRVFVLYFQDSVSGLGEGSPVEFRGVKIGRVIDINVIFDKDNLSFTIPVYIEIEPGRIDQIGRIYEPLVLNELLVKRGLRAQLKLKSFLTGQLIVELDFYPETPIELVAGDPRYQELPTIPSSIIQFTKTLQKLDLDKLAQSAKDTLTQANKTLTALERILTEESLIVRYNLINTLEEMSGAARSVRDLTDYLERNPNAVIFGKD